ncbi:HAMP domain-containing histidine kinase [Geobacter pelophilus]|uniref:histidine kinase n=1 Tax=Geoanaerobacter pelophilus TaxID=60036 RepID=A0AAW4L8J3_9BACT|nr:HAMP domain-containing sensor histidine kinase [Geoanaerobacter pelophilus]MBT0666467.1 HAMP domain-containing histidine kinase [Geoanaerobacter pelophilus]
MLKYTRLIIGVPFCFTLMVIWFAWSAFRASPQIAAENLRGAGLSISAAIEQLVVADASLRSLARYTTPDIAYFALIDRQGIVRFHTNPLLIDHPYTGAIQNRLPDGISEQREQLGTGEEVYILRTMIHAGSDKYLLILALHTYRADQVIRRAQTGITVVSALTVALWGGTILLFYMIRREERHQREMRRQDELARLGEMGAVMAHEIRNPLAGIKGFAQMIETVASIEQACTYADKIVSQSIRMEALVNDLLAFARVDHTEKQNADLTQIIIDCVELLRPEAADHNVTIVVDAPQHITANVTEDRIVQMLLNLIKNGIQSMPDGGEVTVAMRQNRDTAVVSVRDNGTGISQERLPHIFDPFWTSKAKGTGLGLALCRKVAEEHGGTITVSSRENVGTKFVVTLPAVK